MFGKIKHLKPEKGYGFLSISGRPEDVFFNFAIDFEGDPRLLTKGTIVEFDWKEFKGNQVACNLRIVEAPLNVNSNGGAL